MTTPTDTPRDLSRRTLGAIAADSSAALQVLDEVGLDYCCAGERTLAEAADQAWARSRPTRPQRSRYSMKRAWITAAPASGRWPRPPIRPASRSS